MKHLDKIPMTAAETKGRAGKHAAIRRKSSKVLADVRFLMRHITAMVEDAGAMEEVITPSSVDRMFAAVSRRLILTVKDDQKKWLSITTQIRANLALLKDIQSSSAPKPSEN